jgi:vacuolar iron transporter family protein
MMNKIKQHFEDYLSEFVYGGMDGAVTTFAVVAGSAGAHFSTTILIVLGFANLIADGFSMSVGSYLSKKSEIELMAKRGESIKDEASPIINGVTTYLSFMVFGLVPLLAYTVNHIVSLGSTNLFLVSIICTGIAFVGIGYLKSRVAKTPVIRAVSETLVLGVIAAVFAYLVGNLLVNLLTS